MRYFVGLRNGMKCVKEFGDSQYLYPSEIPEDSSEALFANGRRLKGITSMRSGKLSQQFSYSIQNFEELFSCFVADKNNDFTHEMLDKDGKFTVYAISDPIINSAAVDKILKINGFVCFDVLDFGDIFAIVVYLPESYISDLKAFFESDQFSTTVHNYREEGVDPSTYAKYPDITAFNSDLIYPDCSGLALLVDLSVVAEQFSLEFEIC